MYAQCRNLEIVTLHIFYMKEEDYVMMLMSTCGTNELAGDEKFRTIGGVRIRFKYPQTVQFFTCTQMLWTHKMQGTRHILHLKRHGPQGAGVTVFLLFCWLYLRSILIWGRTKFVVWRLLGKFWIPGYPFIGTSSRTPTSGNIISLQKHARARETIILTDTFSLSYPKDFFEWQVNRQIQVIISLQPL